MTNTLAAVAIALVGVATTFGQPSTAAERFTAFAVNMGSGWSGSTATVEIAVERWSTQAEADRLLVALKEQGPNAMLDVLRDIPRVGFIRTPGNLGYDLHFARRVAADEGGERIVLATDRPIGFWEAVNRPRTIDYPFTVIDMRLDREGQGEGKLSLATKITVDRTGKTIELENWGTQPVQLRSVRRDSSR
jgi:hypothetical protein